MYATDGTSSSSVCVVGLRERARPGSGSTHLKSRARRDGVEELLSQSIVVVVDRQLEQVHACSRRRQQCVVGVRSRNRKLRVEVLEAEKRALSTENSKSTPRQQAGEQGLVCACVYIRWTSL